jgi:hypothetical protein
VRAPGRDDCATDGVVAQPDMVAAKISAVTVRSIERLVGPPMCIVSERREGREDGTTARES